MIWRLFCLSVAVFGLASVVVEIHYMLSPASFFEPQPMFNVCLIVVSGAVALFFGWLAIRSGPKA